MDRSRIGLLLVSLFALPFAAFGLFALSKAVPQILGGDGDSQVWLGLLFGVVFTGIGVGLILATVYGQKLSQRQQRLEAEFPSEPWKWRADWAAGRVNSNNRSATIGAWIFATLWNLVSLPVLFAAPHEAAKKAPIVYVALIFPVAGLFLLVRAIRLSLELHEFGKTCFAMSSVPGVVGRELKGMIQARFPHAPDHGIQLRLTCVQRVITGSGNSQSTSERILWRSESKLTAAQLYPGPEGTTIPVSFRIPWDAQPTEKRAPRDMTLWLLEAQADVPGVDYHDVFEVPVFRTAQSPSGPEAATSAAADAQADAERPENPAIQVRESGDGTEFYFPAARNKSFAVSTTVFSLIFGGATYLMSRAHAPFLFPIVFGGATLLLLYITLQMWLATSRVVIGNGILSLRSGWLGIGNTQQIPFEEIAAIQCKITAQQGGGTGTPYYDVELIKKAGGKVTLGHTVRDKDESEWLANQMRRLIGLAPKAMAAAGGAALPG